MSLSERHLQTIEQVKRYLAEHDYPFVKKAVLYGSCVRQEAHYDSDVDILIVVTDNAFTGQIQRLTDGSKRPLPHYKNERTLQFDRIKRQQ